MLWLSLLKVRTLYPYTILALTMLTAIEVYISYSIHSIHCTYIYTGAQKEGAAGLVKGVGKGLVGLIVRPTGGLIDLTSGTLDFVTRYVHACIYSGTFLIRTPSEQCP